MSIVFGQPGGLESRVAPVIALPDGSERIPTEIVLALPDGSERVLWRRTRRVVPASITTSEPPPPPDNTPYAFQTMMSMNTNGKRGMRPVLSTYDPDYMAEYAASLDGSMQFRTVREALEGAPTGAGGAWNWETDGNLKWLDQIAEQYWFKSFIVETRAAFLAGGDFGSSWEAKSRYRIAKWMQRFGDGRTMAIITPGNEPDNPSTDGSWGQVGPGTVAQRLGRYLNLCRWVREELHTGPQAYPDTNPVFPAKCAIIGPTWAFGDLADGGPGAFRADEFLHLNDGEVMDYWDAMDGHWHFAAATRMPGWNGTAETAPSATAFSPYNMSQAIIAVNAVREAAGKPARWIPITTTESGYPINTTYGTWSATANREKLIRVRLANHHAQFHRWGVSLWTVYSWKLSEKSIDYNLVNNAYGEREGWKTILEISDPKQYSMDRFIGGVIPVPNKGQDEYWRSSDWIVFVNGTSAPSGTPPTYGFSEYNRVTMDGTKIRCTSGNNNIIHMPIYLTQVGRPFDLVANVVVSGGAKARLCAYGYDKTKMHAGVTDVTSTSRTLNVRFTPVQHENPYLPNPAYVDFWLEHNGVGTVDFSGFKIIPS